tara:strand:- start:2391 stop:3053 length:663 start_codon:yes stop_codon:yes gene_type:complete
LKDLIKKIIHLFIIKKSYSQDKEDIFLIELFKDLKKGFYIDLGCHHPKRFSNTYLLYKRGWSGINVDANYSTILLFNLFRKRDKNIRALINTNSVSVFYYKFNDSALNGILSPQNAQKLIDVGYKLKKKVKMNSISINDFIKKYGLVNKKINFLKIDLEGIDFELIKILDFTIIDIQVIMIEKKQNKIKEDEMKLYLKNKFYKLIFESNRNLIFSSLNKS